MRRIWVRRALLFFSAGYILIRVMMFIKSADNQTVFFYKQSMDQSFFYYDLLFLVCWLGYLIRLTPRRLYKFLLLIGGTFTTMFYLAMMILSSVSQGGEIKVLPSHQVNDDYLIQMGNLPGMHLGDDSHRDLFVYKKTFPLIYTKIYETNQSIKWDEFEAYRKGHTHITIQNGDLVLVLANKELVIEENGNEAP